MPPRSASKILAPIPKSSQKRRHPLADSIVAESSSSSSPKTTSSRRRQATSNLVAENINDHIEDPTSPLAVNAAEPLDETTLTANAEKELEAWQDFAAEHYEILEQLPLELHRNFRLLRELDDGSTAQTDKLHALVRTYMNQRLATAPHNDKVAEVLALSEGDREMGIPESDGQGGLILPVASTVPEKSTAPDDTLDKMGASTQIDPAKTTTGPEEPRNETSEIDTVPLDDPSASVAPRQDAMVERTIESTERQSASPVAAHTSTRPIQDRTVLSEISRLSREIVRNGEEKVAVAIGAYNAIDRHIRSLDTMLQSEAASFNDQVDLIQTTPAVEVEADQPRTKKKGKKAVVVKDVQEEDSADPLYGEKIDPNEPRYCYCNQVSYGTMINCENDDCKMGWFHLACCGLATIPTGKWWCDQCKPDAIKKLISKPVEGSPFARGGGLDGRVSAGRKRQRA